MTQVTIAGYEIVRQVGGDAASLLYKARRLVREEGAEHRVLLRIFNRPLSPAQYDQSLQWAMKAAAPLSNPAVLHIVDYGSTEDENPYLVMEHAVGHTLAAYFRDYDRAARPQEPLATLTLLYHLALILEDAHRLGIVHRDLQPDQILLTPNGANSPHEAPVALMGLDLPYTLATLGHDEGASQTRYLSPEQKQGEALDGRSNIYSLSMLLYDLLGGEAARAASLEALPPLDTLAPHLSPATQQLVHRGLQSELWKRYHSYSHFMEALQEAIVAEGGAVEALPLPPGEADKTEAAPAAPPAIQPALRVALAQIGLLVLLLAGSFLLLRNGSAQETGGASPMAATPTGLFTGIQWTATPSPTATPSATLAATAVATTTAAPDVPPTVAATPSPSATPTEATATMTPSPSPTVAPTTTDTPVPPPPPTATPVPPTATSEPPPPPTATSEPPPPP
ncbi:MAG: serine/threonine protein kinase, partial [Chloroflexota bacterium]